MKHHRSSLTLFLVGKDESRIEKLLILVVAIDDWQGKLDFVLFGIKSEIDNQRHVVAVFAWFRLLRHLPWTIGKKDFLDCARRDRLSIYKDGIDLDLERRLSFQPKKLSRSLQVSAPLRILTEAREAAARLWLTVATVIQLIL